jgi:hypothetical protein
MRMLGRGDCNRQEQKQIPCGNDRKKSKNNSNCKGFNAKGATGAKFREEEQAMATAIMARRGWIK